MIRVGFYGRVSTEKQSETSTEDQLRLCEERALREGWVITGRYTDKAISGASLIRPGLQELIREAMTGKFDLIIAEAMDRISRDLADVAGVFKRMEYLGVKIFTLSEGEITSLHVGLKGTMNQLFLKDLGDKTRRGLRGRVEQGKSGGGNSYAYTVDKRIDEASGEYVRGERSINEAEAKIVQRIFKEYAAENSPRWIAGRLNREGVPSPSGKGWGASTIYGNRDRGTGILNNELYIGKLIWNRLRYVKDPDTGRRMSRLNPQENWIVKDLPELRIIDQDLWEAAKTVQGKINKHSTALWEKNRPKNLFSHLIKCGCCGGGFSMVSASHLGCSSARNKGTCSNRLTYKREALEQAVVDALHRHLMDEAMCAEFCEEYIRRTNELRSQHNGSLAAYRTEYAKLERERQQIIKSIADGVPGAVLKDRAIALQARREELERLLTETREEPIIFHPNMANRYHQEVQTLIASLSREESRAEASVIIRSLIDRIVLTPAAAGDRLTVDLIGDLAGILSIATKRDKSAVAVELSKLQPVQQDAADDSPEKERTAEFRGSEALVAGAGFEPAAFRL